MARPGLGTRCVQAGYSPKNGEPRQIPIIQSTTFKYESSAEMGKLFDLEASGYFYSRLQNPTNDAVAARIAALEGGTAAMLTGSGMSAIFFSVFNIVGAGDHLVSSSSIYGGSFNLFSVTMKHMGVEVTFVDPDCSPEELDAAFRPNTKAMYGETIANPALTVLDIEKFAAAAHRHGVPLILDNTFATPINCRPFEWGADIVVHSTTKYMDGHAGALGGAIVDSGRFDWTKYPDKYPGLCTPDESYHGVTYTERFGLAGAYITKATVQLMRDLGAVQSPQNAYYLNLGLESLHVRMQRHCENAQRVAEFLQRHENVSWVQYCGLPGDKYYELGQKYLPNGSCGVVSFGVRGGRAAAEAVMSKLQVAAIETHVADSHTCCLHPASTTHRQMNAEDERDGGAEQTEAPGGTADGEHHAVVDPGVCRRGGSRTDGDADVHSVPRAEAILFCTVGAVGKMTVLTAAVQPAALFLHAKEDNGIRVVHIVGVTGKEGVVQPPGKLAHMCGQSVLVFAGHDAGDKTVHAPRLGRGAGGCAHARGRIQNGAGLHIFRRIDHGETTPFIVICLQYSASHGNCQ